MQHFVHQDTDVYSPRDIFIICMFLVHIVGNNGEDFNWIENTSDMQHADNVINAPPS